MRRLILLLPLLLLCVFSSTNAQENPIPPDPDPEKGFFEQMEDTLALLAFVIVNDSLEENRFGACREMIPRLVKTLKQEGSFDYPFNRLKSISIQYPQDSTFRIFTWQLYVNKDDYRYYGAIQMNTGSLSLFPLIDRSFNVKAAESAVLPAKEWYGSVYYNIKDVEAKDGKKYYTLFGFDAYSFLKKRKIIDVLSFNEKGEPIFGHPVFKMKEGAEKNRIIREYSSEVSTRCNYDEILEMIIFDHLITLNGKYGEGPTNYPDGSYEGFSLKDGVWTYMEKIFDQVSDEAPRPAPILDQRTKDIFGNQDDN